MDLVRQRKKLTVTLGRHILHPRLRLRCLERLAPLSIRTFRRFSAACQAERWLKKERCEVRHDLQNFVKLGLYHLSNPRWQSDFSTAAATPTFVAVAKGSP